MRDTPISDSTPHNVADLGMQIRRLERQLNAANERIKRLEEALDKIGEVMKRPASNHRLMQIAGPARQVINIVKQAKEAKL